MNGTMYFVHHPGVDDALALSARPDDLRRLKARFGDKAKAQRVYYLAN